MAKKPKKQSSKAPALPSWWPTGFQPLVARDPTSVVGGPFAKVFMLKPTFEGTLCVQRWANPPGQIGVRDRVVSNAAAKQYVELTDDYSLQSELEELKVQMLAEGATPEAVRLVGEFIPISEKEYAIMANKLSKAGAKKAPAKKAETKAAPKKADTKAKSTSKKSNAEAGGIGQPREFKYKILVKPTEALATTREGTWTRHMLQIILDHTEAAAAREALVKSKEFNDRRLDFGWAEKKGYIKREAAA